MQEELRTVERKGWIAVVMGLIMTGLAQIYNGEMMKGVCLYLFGIILYVIGFSASTRLPDRYLIIGLLLVLAIKIAIHLFSIFDGYKTAKNKGAGYRLKPYNKWYVYLVVWLVGPLMITGLATRLVRNHIVQAYKLPSSAMEPAIMSGEKVLVDKRVYKKRPLKIGDIVVFVYPDDRSQVVIRRVAGLPGDTVKTGDGKQYRVPHGSIFVMSDNKDEGTDSRHFGPVPLADVVGKARQVFSSAGKEGFRWDRIGRTFDHH
ncbi:MAG: signal peptidase I [Nitrospirota bacterium]